MSANLSGRRTCRHSRKDDNADSNATAEASIIISGRSKSADCNEGHNHAHGAYESVYVVSHVLSCMLYLTPTYRFNLRFILFPNTTESPTVMICTT